MFYHKKIGVIITALLVAISVFVSCINNEEEDVRGEAYAGEQACVSCHKDIYQQHLLSAHQNTSKIATDKTVLGNFTSPHNAFAYNDSDKVIMHKQNGAFYETEYMDGKEKRSEKLDIVIGSGRKAQTYLYQKGAQIYELPASYFLSINAWANSPGFPATQPFFDRNIPSACFGCHGSAANVTLQNKGSLQVVENYLPNQLILGIDCERCHGPAKAHVDYQTAHPDEKGSKFITAIASLTRTQQMDMCAVCHSGVKEPIRPIFGFKPGNKLEDYYLPDISISAARKSDVHDTQAQSLMASVCYRKSNTLTCITCHNPHQKERDNVVLFSQRCMTCHSEAAHTFCKLKDISAEVLKANCIDCHMPARASNIIQMLSHVDGKQQLQPDYIRTHTIAVYPEETQKLIALWKEKESK